MVNRYLKVLKQIDKRMTAKGYRLVSVSDGEESLPSTGASKTALYDWAMQCDFGTMTYITPHDSAKRCTFYLAYGNLLSETIYDMGYNCEQAEADCDQVSDEIAELYEREYA